jgi:hypothetical protein
MILIKLETVKLGMIERGMSLESFTLTTLRTRRTNFLITPSSHHSTRTVGKTIPTKSLTMPRHKCLFVSPEIKHSPHHD